jgi:ribosomal protein L9
VNRKSMSMAVVCTLLAGTAAAQVAPNAARTSDSDKLEAAADNLARMKAALKQVLGRAEQARNEKDVVKLNCVNEKLTQIKALIKVAEQSDITLHESVASKDIAGEAAFSKIAIARTKVDGLRSESEQCIGQLAYMVDEKTTVEVEQPGDLPGREVASIGLGVAKRGENPADVAGDFGSGAIAPGAGASGGFTFPSPTIVRAPAASPSN